MERKRHTPGTKGFSVGARIIRKRRTAEQLYGGMKATEALAARLLRRSSASRNRSRRTVGSSRGLLRRSSVCWLTLSSIRRCSSRRLLQSSGSWPDAMGAGGDAWLTGACGSRAGA